MRSERKEIYVNIANEIKIGIEIVLKSSFIERNQVLKRLKLLANS